MSRQKKSLALGIMFLAMPLMASQSEPQKQSLGLFLVALAAQIPAFPIAIGLANDGFCHARKRGGIFGLACGLLGTALIALDRITKKTDLRKNHPSIGVFGRISADILLALGIVKSHNKSGLSKIATLAATAYIAIATYLKYQLNGSLDPSEYLVGSLYKMFFKESFSKLFKKILT